MQPDQVHGDEHGDARCAIAAVPRARQSRAPALGDDAARLGSPATSAVRSHVDHASASATCSGVSHPGPNARVICGANTCESPRTDAGVAVGDHLAAGEHDHARRDRRREFDVVRGEIATPPSAACRRR